MLQEDDARAVIRLLGEVAVLDGDHRAKKRYLVSGLAKIVEADVWGWAHLQQSDDQLKGTPVPYLLIDGGWADESKRSLFYQSSSHPQFPVFFDDRLRAYAQRLKHFTVSRRQFISDDEWYTSDLYQEYRLPAGVDDFIYSVYLLGVTPSGSLYQSM